MGRQRRLQARLLLLLAAPSAGVSPSPTTTTTTVRDEVPFDYAWRFRTLSQDPAPAPPPPRSSCPPFNETSSATCSGLAATPAGNGSAAACKQHCCASADCFVWQYAVNPAAAGPPARERCWTGQCKVSGQPNPNWVSQAAAVQPSPPAPSPGAACAYCAVAVNDSSWALVDAPHDYIVTQPIDKSESGGAGYVSRIDLT